MSKLEVDLKRLTKLGPYPIKILKSEDAVSYIIQHGKIGPVDIEVLLNEITDYRYYLDFKYWYISYPRYFKN